MKNKMNNRVKRSKTKIMKKKTLKKPAADAKVSTWQEYAEQNDGEDDEQIGDDGKDYRCQHQHKVGSSTRKLRCHQTRVGHCQIGPESIGNPCKDLVQAKCRSAMRSVMQWCPGMQVSLMHMCTKCQMGQQCKKYKSVSSSRETSNSFKASPMMS